MILWANNAVSREKAANDLCCFPLTPYFHKAPLLRPRTKKKVWVSWGLSHIQAKTWWVVLSLVPSVKSSLPLFLCFMEAPTHPTSPAQTSPPAWSWPKQSWVTASSPEWPEASRKGAGHSQCHKQQEFLQQRRKWEGMSVNSASAEIMHLPTTLPFWWSYLNILKVLELLVFCSI